MCFLYLIPTCYAVESANEAKYDRELHFKIFTASYGREKRWWLHAFQAKARPSPFS